jgi:hypothetical protein
VKAPKGSAVFEVVSEQLYRGVVLDRMQAKGTNISSGLVQYEEDGTPAKLTYGPKDLLVGSRALLCLTHKVLSWRGRCHLVFAECSVCLV